MLAGYDADGSPRYRPLSEAMAELDTEHAVFVREASAFEAAANCFLRQGVTHAA